MQHTYMTSGNYISDIDMLPLKRWQSMTITSVLQLFRMQTSLMHMLPLTCSAMIVCEIFILYINNPRIMEAYYSTAEMPSGSGLSLWALWL